MVLWLILLQHAPCGKFTCGERAGEIILSLSGYYRCLSHYREKAPRPLYHRLNRFHGCSEAKSLSSKKRTKSVGGLRS